MTQYLISTQVADLLEARAAHIAETVVMAQLEQDPDIAQRYGARERRKSVEDATHTVKVLAEAVANDDPASFVRYITWLDGILQRVGLPRSDLGRHLALLRDHLSRELPPDLVGLVRACLDPAVKVVLPDSEVRG
jgi:hypothetical protein